MFSWNNMSSPTQAQRNVQLEDIYPNGFDVSYKIFILMITLWWEISLKLFLDNYKIPGKFLF